MKAKAKHNIKSRPEKAGFFLTYKLKLKGISLRFEGRELLDY